MIYQPQDNNSKRNVNLLRESVVYDLPAIILPIILAATCCSSVLNEQPSSFKRLPKIFMVLAVLSAWLLSSWLNIFEHLISPPSFTPALPPFSEPGKFMPRVKWLVLNEWKIKMEILTEITGVQNRFLYNK